MLINSLSSSRIERVEATKFNLYMNNEIKRYRQSAPILYIVPDSLESNGLSRQWQFVLPVVTVLEYYCTKTLSQYSGLSSARPRVRRRFFGESVNPTSHLIRRDLRTKGELQLRVVYVDCHRLKDQVHLQSEVIRWQMLQSEKHRTPTATCSLDAR